VNYFNIREDAWRAGKAEMRAILQAVAARRGMIAYSELASQMMSLQIEPFGGVMSELLGEIGAEEASEGRGILTVVVVHKSGDMEPGQGFYDLAAILGRDTSDRLTLWIKEMHRVHDCWANGRQSN